VQGNRGESAPGLIKPLDSIGRHYRELSGERGNLPALRRTRRGYALSECRRVAQNTPARRDSGELVRIELVEQVMDKLSIHDLALNTAPEVFAHLDGWGTL